MIVLEVSLDEEECTIDDSEGMVTGIVIGVLGSPFTRMIFYQTIITHIKGSNIKCEELGRLLKNGRMVVVGMMMFV